MVIEISVRAFVEFLMRQGDIDNRKSGGGEEAMAEGARIHRMIQRRMGAEYHAEYTLRQDFDMGPYTILIEGRADGIIDDERGGQVVVDEIKSTHRELRKIKHPEPVHLAQAKVYAYIYAKQCQLAEIGVRMTYCHVESEEIKYFHENYKYEQLESWFLELLEEYKKWSDFSYEWNLQRTDSIRQLVFPFDYREGQKQLVGYVYQTIVEHKKLFMEAPTGVGKTISTLYPSIKAVGEGKADKIFYLTAKTITGSVCRETLDLLRQQDLRMKNVVITAKEKMCPLDECVCNPESCPYAKGHYDRINDAVYDLLTSEDAFDRDTILAYALRHEVCPFEMSLDMSLFSDCVICDYNYLFDPRAYLRRFFAEGLGGKYLFLIDEAHNLVDRGRSMYSATLVKEEFLAFKQEIKDHTAYIARLAEKCNKEMLAMKKQCPDYLVWDSHAALVNSANKLYVAIHNYLDDHEDSPVREPLMDMYFKLSQFLDTYDRMDAAHYVTYTGYDDEGNFFIKEFCVDPREELKKCMEKGVGSILFSATFLPIQYYKSLLGGEEDDYEVYAKSSFPKDRQVQLIASDVTSKYTRRNANEYQNIARYIYDIASARQGNYIAFFPSHVFLDEVYRAFEENYNENGTIRTLVQKGYMSEPEREAFLQCFTQYKPADFSSQIQMDIEFEADFSDFDEIDETIEDDLESWIYDETDEDGVIISEREFPMELYGQNADENMDLATQSGTLIGFCVMGGIFSEGIDLKNDSLIGAMIVGTGLPQVCAEREILKRHFDEQGEDGFDYAYKIPGMNKVLQAAGRVIRTQTDAGVVALLDERFLQKGYRRMFPEEWTKIQTVTIKNAHIQACNFWEELDIK